jgi:PmbA protein
MITEQEINIARHCISYALENGADAVRVSLNDSTMDSCTLLNGVLDKVTHAADRSIYLYIFADKRYGTFSTNRLEKEDLEKFILQSIAMVRMLGEDECRTLPSPERTAKDAKTGLELGMYDSRYEGSDSDTRLERAKKMSICTETADENYTLISEECEYSESCDDNFVADSQGFEGRHTETCFSVFSEMTIQDTEGAKYSGFWWESSFDRDGVDLKGCARKALERAANQIGPKKRRSGHYKMVVDTSVATKLIAPILTALNASSIQQKMSFLEDSVGQQIFPEGLTLMDLARTPGKNGSRLFDTEGVATKDAPIIEDGVVKQYFVNTYMAAKMGIEPTVEDISRPFLMPFVKDKALSSQEKTLSLKDLLELSGSGILVTGFNGGNCNPVTGDFSFGIEGFAFSRGKVAHPVREMLITGNIIELWNSLTAVAADARPSVRWQVGSLAFENVSFSA